MPDMPLSSDTVNAVSNIGAMGLLALIVLGVFWLLVKVGPAYREAQKENRDHLDRLMHSIRDDRHADRNALAQVVLAMQVENREQRDAFEAETKTQRQHDEQKHDRMMSAHVEMQKTTNEALHRVEEAIRVMGQAVKEIGRHT